MPASPDSWSGADSYLFGRGWGVDTVQENDTTPSMVDRVILGAGIVQADTAYRRVGNNLEVSIAGTSDKLIIKDWYLGSQYQVEEFKYSDGTTITSSQVAGLLSAMASFGGASAAALGSSQSAGGTDWRPGVDLAIPSFQP